jgi:hypothetical protein
MPGVSNRAEPEKHSRWRVGLRPWLSLTTAGIVPHPGHGLHSACPLMDAGRCGDDGVPQTMGLLVRPPTGGHRRPAAGWSYARRHARPRARLTSALQRAAGACLLPRYALTPLGSRPPRP